MTIVEELENSIDIVELVSRYVKLKKAGANYKAVCPFPGHTEKTPSFIVSPAKQLAYCFGCHKGGGALKFIMDIENIEFKEAIQILGNITGKKIEGFDNKQYQIQKNIYSLYKDVVVYYKKSLENNPEAQKYLFDRGLDKESFEKFNFGFADSGVALYNYLKEKGYNDDLIKQSNIFVNIGQRKDKFIGRIMFPIQNLRGDFVAFTARILNSGEPKYLNSPSSKLYDKSEILYGLYQAKSEIIKKDFVIIVEGQMDVISMHKAGFTNTIAVSGTALTEKHLQNIKRLTHKIYICFDGDPAGKKATKLALEICKNKGIEVKIISLPENSDPDDILKKGEDFNKFIENAKSPISYYIEESNFEITSIEDKKKLLTQLLEILKSYLDPVEQDVYLKEISEKLDLKEYIVYDKFRRLKIQRNNKIEEINNQNYNLEDIAIAYIILDKKNIDFLNDNIIFKEEIGKDLQKILENSNELEKFPLEKKDNIKAISLKLELEQEDDNDTKKQENLQNFIKQLNTFYYKNIVSRLKKQMQDGDEKAFVKYSEIVKKAKQNNIK